MAVEIIQKEIMEISSMNIMGSHGSYSLEDKIAFDSCRERFAAHFNEKTKGFYFKHPKDIGENIAKFIHKLERFLGLRRYTKFNFTNFKTILYVKPPKFWRECPIKRSLFTSFLRSGIQYNPERDNFEEALLFNETPRTWLTANKKALLRFLCGYTDYKGKKPSMHTDIVTEGWQWAVRGLDDTGIKKTFKHPKNKRPKIDPEKFGLKNYVWL